MENDWQRRQHDIQEAERRGRLMADVNALSLNMAEIKTVMKDIQTSVAQLSKSLVTREEYTKLETIVEHLSTREKYIMGALGLLVFLSQAVPRVWDWLWSLR